MKRSILAGLVLLSMLLTLSFLPIVSALESNGFKWTVMDDPSPSEPSQWVVQNGTLQQLSNIYRTDREYEFYQGTHIVAGSLDWADYVLSFDMKSADNDGIGAIVRYQDKDNYYRFIMVQDSDNHGPFRHLEKFVNGVRTVLAEDKNGYLPGRAYSMQFKALGNDLEVWMDGSKILSAADETFRSGKIGFLSYASRDMEIANVKVVDQYGKTLSAASDSTKGDVHLSGSWKMAGHQTGFNDWEADLALNSDGTLSWTETKGANVGATRAGTWQFDGTTFTMTWFSPGGGKTNWSSKSVSKDYLGDGTYTVESAPGGTWTATRVAEGF